MARWEELRKFAENTSVKGVSRIMKAKTLPIRVLWVVSVLGFLFMSFGNCAELIQEYMQYSKIMQRKELHVFRDYHRYKDMFSLPDVTVCNQNPLPAYQGYNGTSYQEYVRLVSLMEVISDLNETKRFLSPREYLEYLGPKVLTGKHDEHKFLIDCL